VTGHLDLGGRTRTHSPQRPGKAMRGFGWSQTRNVFPGWWLVAAGAGMQFLIGGLLFHLYGAYVVLLQREFGWSKTALSTVFSVMRIESGLLGPFQGWLLDRYGPRAVMRVGMAAVGIGFLALSQVQSLSQFIACFLVMAIGVSLAGYMSISVAIVAWFHRRRALALSMISIGFPVGGLIVPVVMVILERWGWRGAAVASGLVFLTVGMALAQFFRRIPRDLGLEVDGANERDLAASARYEPAFTAREALAAPAFWTLSFGHASALVIVSGVMVHLVPHVIETLGFTLAEAGFVVMALTVMQFLGTMVGGYVGDRVNKRYLAAGAMLMHGAGLLFLAYASSWVAVAAFALLHGVAWGARGPLMTAMRADYFGTRAFGTILGFSSMIVMLGTTGGPILAGVLFDRFGSYQPAFLGIASFALVGSVLFLVSQPPRYPRP